jgi:nucleotide-binding universal stress UspA family protein
METSRSQVVVAYDFSKPADVALQRAVDLACTDANVTLHFITVLNNQQTYETADSLHEGLVRMLRTIFRIRQPQVDVDFCVHVRLGKPADEILALAREIGADQIILGCHDRNALGRILVGSVSTEVLHRALCPVTVARLKGYPHVKLDKVVEVSHVAMRPRPHRYSYSSSVAQVRPVDWPIS